MHLNWRCCCDVQDLKARRSFRVLEAEVQMVRQLFFSLVVLVASVHSLSAQTVLFDGLTNGDRQATALLVPAVVTSDDYSLLGRFSYGVGDRVNLFGLGGGRFNGDAVGLLGVGWAANFYQQTEALPVNFGFFNSFVFPLQRRGPDAFVTVTPVFSHTWERETEGSVTPYFGASATFKIDGRGTDVNAVLGVKFREIAEQWDFVGEVGIGEKSQFAVGFVYRF